MFIKPLALICNCGHKASSFKILGASSNFEIIVSWTCENCGEEVAAKAKLEYIAQLCREAAGGEGQTPSNIEERMKYTSYDLRFLAKHKIRITEDQQ